MNFDYYNLIKGNYNREMYNSVISTVEYLCSRYDVRLSYSHFVNPGKYDNDMLFKVRYLNNDIIWIYYIEGVKVNYISFETKPEYLSSLEGYTKYFYKVVKRNPNPQLKLQFNSYNEISEVLPIICDKIELYLDERFPYVPKTQPKKSIKYIDDDPIEEIEYQQSVVNTKDVEIVDYTPHPELLDSFFVPGSKLEFKRNPMQSKIALQRANYSCEYNIEHESFIRKKNNKKYTETHHLIPVSQQKLFDYSLDVPANIISLCSNCHNCIHYGVESKVLLFSLYEERKNELKMAGIEISFEELCEMYNV